MIPPEDASDPNDHRPAARTGASPSGDVTCFHPGPDAVFRSRLGAEHRFGRNPNCKRRPSSPLIHSPFWNCASSSAVIIVDLPPELLLRENLSTYFQHPVRTGQALRNFFQQKSGTNEKIACQPRRNTNGRWQRPLQGHFLFHKSTRISQNDFPILLFSPGWLRHLPYRESRLMTLYLKCGDSLPLAQRNHEPELPAARATDSDGSREFVRERRSACRKQQHARRKDENLLGRSQP